MCNLFRSPHCTSAQVAQGAACSVYQKPDLTSPHCGWGLDLMSTASQLAVGNFTTGLQNSFRLVLKVLQSSAGAPLQDRKLVQQLLQKLKDETHNQPSKRLQPLSIASCRAEPAPELQPEKRVPLTW